MTFPAGNYLDQNTRTEGEMKLALEDFLKAVKQVPGAGVTEQALTLATDAITPAAGASGIISIDTEAAAAADNLANIVLTNVPEGSCLLLRIANNARVVTVKHLAGGSGQLSLRSAADLAMSATTQWLCVKRTGTLLEEQWRSGKEFLKSPTADSLTMTGGINGARGNITQHATTMNPFAATSPDTLDGTGAAVTITDFVAAPQGGIHRTLYLIAGTIITHGGSITVDGNMSYTVQAGDALELESVTTTTFRVHITKKDGTAVLASDATLMTTDVTTNNASTGKHGFLKKLSNVATEFMDGQGNWSVPAAGATLGTQQASTAGTAIDFTGIPAGTKEIKIMLVGVSTNGSSNYLVQLGDAGGIETSGYSSEAARESGVVANSTAGLIMSASLGASQAMHGTITLTLENAAVFTWTATGMFGTSAGSVQFGCGSKSLSQELSQLRFTTVSANTFNAGVINIQYRS